VTGTAAHVSLAEAANRAFQPPGRGSRQFRPPVDKVQTGMRTRIGPKRAKYKKQCSGEFAAQHNDSMFDTN
jgi:hypothetical protein